MLEAARRSRADLKRLARWLDSDDGRVLRPHLLQEAARRGVELPEFAEEWPSKRLLRLALARERGARRRRNPIPLDEAFRCVCCGLQVPAGGHRARNHCPRCLRSLHVDMVPGDRAATCGGVLEPVGVELVSRVGMVILFRCSSCGQRRRNRAMLTGEWPDDGEALRVLAAGGGAPALPMDGEEEVP